MRDKISTEQIRRCVDDCLSCYKTCLETMMHCLAAGGGHAEPAHVRTLLDCARICNITAEFILTGSEFEERAGEVCAEICGRCADDCEKLAEDRMMKACAEQCRRCADSCREMAGLKVETLP